MSMYFRRAFANSLGAAALSATVAISGIAIGQTTQPAPDSPRADPTDKRGSRGVDVGDDLRRPVQPQIDRTQRIDRGTRQDTQIRDRTNPANQLRNTDGKLVRNIDPQRPVLGIRIEDADQGVTVTKVLKDSPAQQAGLKKGDHVVALNGQNVTSTEQLISKLSGMNNKEDVKLSIKRDGEQQEMTVGLSTYKQVFGSFEDVAQQQGIQPRREVLRPNLDENADDVRQPRDSATADEIDLPAVPADEANETLEEDEQASENVKSDEKQKEKQNAKKDRQNKNAKNKDGNSKDAKDKKEKKSDKKQQKNS